MKTGPPNLPPDLTLADVLLAQEQSAREYAWARNHPGIDPEFVKQVQYAAACMSHNIRIWLGMPY